MSARAKWASCAAAFAVGGLIAAIPAFVDKAPKRHRIVTYQWIAKLPETPDGLARFGGKSVAIATAPNDRQLLASRWLDPSGILQVCFTLGNGGKSCERLDRSSPIQLVGREVDEGSTVWWGVMGDAARSVRVEYADGSSRVFPSRRAFGFTGKPPRSFTALDRDDRPWGTVRANAFVPIECNVSSCSSYITFGG